MLDANFDSAESLTSRPFAERQFLVVTASAAQEANPQEENIEDTPPSQQWFGKAIGALGLLGRRWEVSVGTILATASLEVYKSLKRAWDKGLPIQKISFDVSQQFEFPPGHPRIDVVYACHPANPATYYPLADFHRVTFEDKFAEAMRLLMSLGADTLYVRHVTGWSSEFAANITIPIGSAKPTAAADATRTQQESNELLFEATLEGSHEPQLPQNMVWFKHEPTWKSIADGRLKYGLDAFRLNVTYKDNYGVDSKLAAAIQGAGLGIGGKFETHLSTIWQINGSFRSAKS
jgi:hypothetical protein